MSTPETLTTLHDEVEHVLNQLTRFGSLTAQTWTGDGHAVALFHFFSNPTREYAVFVDFNGEYIDALS